MVSQGKNHPALPAFHVLEVRGPRRCIPRGEVSSPEGGRESNKTGKDVGGTGASAGGGVRGGYGGVCVGRDGVRGRRDLPSCILIIPTSFSPGLVESDH